MLFLFTLGTYSFVPMSYLWAEVSMRLAVMLYAMLVCLGLLAAFTVTLFNWNRLNEALKDKKYGRLLVVRHPLRLTRSTLRSARKYRFLSPREVPLELGLAMQE